MTTRPRKPAPGTPAPGKLPLPELAEMKRRGERIGRTPDDPGPAAGLVPDALLLDLVGRRVAEGGRVEEDDLVRDLAVPSEDIFQHAQQPDPGQALADLLLELAVDGGDVGEIDREEFPLPAQQRIVPVSQLSAR